MRCERKQGSAKWKEDSRGETHDLEGSLLGRASRSLRRLELFELTRRADILDDLVPDAGDENLLLVRIGADGDTCEEAPDRLVVLVGLGSESLERLVLRDAEGKRGGEASRREERHEVRAGGEDAEEMGEGAMPLLQVGLLGRGRRLLERLGAREEDRKEGETGLGPDDLEDVVAVHQESEHADDHAELGLSDDSHDGRDNRVEERFRLGLDGDAALSARGGRVELVKDGRLDDNVERIEGGDKECEESERLLGREVADRAREDALALQGREDRDERVRRAKRPQATSQLAQSRLQREEGERTKHRAAP